MTCEHYKAKQCDCLNGKCGVFEKTEDYYARHKEPPVITDRKTVLTEKQKKRAREIAPSVYKRYSKS